LPEGLEVQGAVLSDQIKSLDWRSRDASRLGLVPRSVWEEVLAKILTLVEYD
jgi:mRNA interferase MazF